MNTFLTLPSSTRHNLSCRNDFATLSESLLAAVTKRNKKLQSYSLMIKIKVRIDNFLNKNTTWKKI